MAKKIEVEYSTQDVMAVAYRAYKINGNSYIKDTRRFSEEENKTQFSNKELVKFQLRPEFRPTDFTAFVTTPEDYADVDNAMKHFKRYVFGIIGDNLSDFQRDIVNSATTQSVVYHQLGIIAYVPEFVTRESKQNDLKKTIRTEYRDSSYIGPIGEKTEGVCKIIDSHYSNHYERYAYTADVMGNLINFWNKYELPIGERRKFTAKIKEHTKNRLFGVDETKLNYVKLYKV
jgi:hypothetical protein|tara:strand:+ start:2451 stop:3143 length:693 start_codon:yes stop_codon:yes gene_type:complete